ncbi:MAG: tRNA modification GTPase [Thermoguttaceae bacterium]
MSFHHLDETIIAQASATGPGLRGMIRLSGPHSVVALNKVLNSPFVESNCPSITPSQLFPWESERPVPAYIYFWPENRGYTGQKSLELHLWSVQPILDALIRRMITPSQQSRLEPELDHSHSLLQGTVRLAEPGEFTLRAFLSGRLDLTQAEAVLGVIDAESPEQLHVALGQLAGGLGGPLHRIQEELLNILVDLEAGFDFPEEDITFCTQERLQQQLDSIVEPLRTVCEQIRSRNIGGRCPRVALIGRPNAGKSSLYNRLTDLVQPSCEKERPDCERNRSSYEYEKDKWGSEESPLNVAKMREQNVETVLGSTIQSMIGADCSPSSNACNLEVGAIVSPIPGTTRDYLEKKVSDQGQTFTLIDTAGLVDMRGIEQVTGEEVARSNTGDLDVLDPDEQGQQLTRKIFKEADLLLFCVESQESGNRLQEPQRLQQQVQQREQQQLQQRTLLRQVQQVSSQPILGVLTKCDSERYDVETEQTDWIITSAKTGFGLDRLKKAIGELLAQQKGRLDVVPNTAIRCRHSIEQALARIEEAQRLLDSNVDEVLLASEFRVALDHLGQMLGTVHTEDILAKIFSRFCVGK